MMPLMLLNVMNDDESTICMAKDHDRISAVVYDRTVSYGFKN